MKPAKRDAVMAALIRDIVRLDCQSLPTKFEPTSSLAPTRNRPPRIASVATIRALLVTFGILHTNLSGICKVTDLKEYYEFRRPLTERVLPESAFAFEYCRQTLSLKGATQSPAATKLANLANGVCDYAELIRERLSIALEYHELKNVILGDIQQFVTKDEFSEADVGPVMFSLTVSLPLRLEAFAQGASKDFPGYVDQLNKLVSDITEQAKRRSRLAEQNTKQSVADQPQPGAKDSPIRPKLRPLRGVKYRQPLLAVHQRIPSLQEIELKKVALDSHASVSPKANADKENSLATPKLAHPRSISKSSISRERPVRALQSASPRLNARTGSRASLRTSPRLAKTGARSPRAETSRLKQPTKIENRRVAQPVDPPVDPPVLRERPSTRTLSSRVSRPTLIQPRPSIQELRQPGTSRRSSAASRRWSNASDSSMNSDICVTPQSSIMALSSPETSVIDETPLSRRSLGTSLPLRQRQSSISLQVPRTRRTVSAKTEL